MSGLFSIIKDTLSLKNEGNIKVGLSQLNMISTVEAAESNTDNISIRNKAVKLSDLMRRSSSY